MREEGATTIDRINRINRNRTLRPRLPAPRVSHPDPVPLRPFRVSHPVPYRAYARLFRHHVAPGAFPARAGVASPPPPRVAPGPRRARFVSPRPPRWNSRTPAPSPRSSPREAPPQSSYRDRRLASLATSPRRPRRRRRPLSPPASGRSSSRACGLIRGTVDRTTSKMYDRICSRWSVSL